MKDAISFILLNSRFSCIPSFTDSSPLRCLNYLYYYCSLWKQNTPNIFAVSHGAGGISWLSAPFCHVLMLCVYVCELCTCASGEVGTVCCQQYSKLLLIADALYMCVCLREIVSVCQSLCLSRRQRGAAESPWRLAGQPWQDFINMLHAANLKKCS